MFDSLKQPCFFFILVFYGLPFCPHLFHTIRTKKDLSPVHHRLLCTNQNVLYEVQYFTNFTAFKPIQFSSPRNKSRSSKSYLSWHMTFHLPASQTGTQTWELPCLSRQATRSESEGQKEGIYALVFSSMLY